MVGRQRAVPRGERRAAEIGELFGMELDRQAECVGGVEDLADLGGREGDALAEAVDRVDEPLRRGGGEGRQADLREVARPVGGEVGGTAWAPR